MFSTRKSIIVAAIFCAGFMSGSLLRKATATDKSVVIKQDLQNQAAQDWLDLIDQGQYKGSWDAASAEAKATSEEWKGSVVAARGALGERLTRGLETRQEVTSLKGWPDGKYVVMTFSSSFVNKQQALETLTLMRDTDGSWRVVAYSIK
jgi:hypothetical protein